MPAPFTFPQRVARLYALGVRFDIEDLHILAQYTWHMDMRGYCQCYRPSDRRLLRMHEVLLGPAPVDMVIDHINRDTTDNRRSNLRYATREENVRNAVTVGRYRTTTGVRHP